MSPGYTVLQVRSPMRSMPQTVIKRLYKMVDGHQQSQFVDPEAWQTELGSVLSSVETFDAGQRARSPGLPVDKVAAKIERQIKEDTAMTRPIPIPVGTGQDKTGTSVYVEWLLALSQA
ncbi:hypothetical protein FMEXI_10952 [Fusarium mexicanum]|uniref:Uncharacterized protein n=1 Tax=Fusarium mexicanum TaxID=751941 RepID=A0A8H5MPB8_9HYPO|nr:hypothetical protein FMEXI_10952 [Fusarium mexicanum]